MTNKVHVERKGWLTHITFYQTNTDKISKVPQRITEFSNL